MFMQTFKTKILHASTMALLALGLSTTPSQAQFFSDFNSGLPPGTAVYGNAAVDTTGGVGGSGALKLTSAVNGQVGSFVIEDLTPGSAVTRFRASFKAQVGGGTATAADGFSFCFASDLPNATWGEEGAGTGLTVAFDSYDNGGGEAPAIDVFWNGSTVAHRLFAVSQGPTGTNYFDVLINLDCDGTLDVVYKGTIIYTNLATPYRPITGGRFGFGGRTGGLNDNHWIDNLKIDTFTPGPVVVATQPQSVTVNQGFPATFSACLDGTPPYSLQWCTNGAPIPNATNTSYTTPPTVPADNGTVFQLKATNSLGFALSDNAILTVRTDTNPPVVVRA